jgi:pimeloyl-ACP methyl ester carboxylesterase
MDLRGYAASDKPPEGHTLPGLARDVTAVIGSLGAPSAVVVGQGFGGLVAWTMAVSCPQSVRAIAVFDAPHPASSQRRALWVSPRAAAQIAGLRLPALRDELARRHDVAGHALTTWSAPGWPDEATLGLYREVMGIPFAQSKAIEQIRWAAQTRASREHRRFLARFERPPALPVLHVQGVYDGLFRTSAMACPELAGGDYRFERVFDAGHFVPEEAPDRATELLLGWLGRVAA